MRGCSCAHADIAALKPGFFQRTILEFQFQTQEGWKRCKRMPTMTIQLSDSCCFGGIPRVNHLPGKKTVCWQPHIDFFSFHGTGVSSCSKCNTFLSSIRSEELMQQQRALVEKVKQGQLSVDHRFWRQKLGLGRQFRSAPACGRVSKRVCKRFNTKQGHSIAIICHVGAAWPALKNVQPQSVQRKLLQRVE